MPFPRPAFLSEAQHSPRRGGCPHPPGDATHRDGVGPGRGRPGLREPWWIRSISLSARLKPIPFKTIGALSFPLPVEAVPFNDYLYAEVAYAACEAFQDKLDTALTPST